MNDKNNLFYYIEKLYLLITMNLSILYYQSKNIKSLVVVRSIRYLFFVGTWAFVITHIYIYFLYLGLST